MKPEKLIINKVVEFVNENWYNINHSRVEIVESKEKFIRKCKKDVQFSLWVFMEVANWAMIDKNKKYVREIIVNDESEDGFTVIKINNKYIKLDLEPKNYDYIITFVEPKYKKVLYFE